MKTRNLNLILTSRLRAVTIYALRQIKIPIKAKFREGKDLKRPDCYVMSHCARCEFCIMCSHSLAQGRLVSYFGVESGFWSWLLVNTVKQSGWARI